VVVSEVAAGVAVPGAEVGRGVAVSSLVPQATANRAATKIMAVKEWDFSVFRTSSKLQQDLPPNSHQCCLGRAM